MWAKYCGGEVAAPARKEQLRGRGAAEAAFRALGGEAGEAGAGRHGGGPEATPGARAAALGCREAQPDVGAEPAPRKSGVLGAATGARTQPPPPSPMPASVPLLAECLEGLGEEPPAEAGKGEEDVEGDGPADDGGDVEGVEGGEAAAGKRSAAPRGVRAGAEAVAAFSLVVGLASGLAASPPQPPDPGT